MRSLSRSSTRRISPWPGRNARIEPASARKRLHDRVRHLVFDARRLAAAEIARVDRKGAAFAFDDRRAGSEQRRHARAVERRRHDEDAQIVAQAALRVERQRKAKIGIE